MVQMVRMHLLSSGHDIRYSGYVNQSRNYFFQTNAENYLLKWNTDEFKAAGYLCPGLGKGPGMTLSLQVYESMKEQKPIILFATSSNDERIFSVSFEEFARLSEPYQQFGGEWVRVILTKSLMEWYTPT